MLLGLACIAVLIIIAARPRHRINLFVVLVDRRPTLGTTPSEPYFDPRLCDTSHKYLNDAGAGLVSVGCEPVCHRGVPSGNLRRRAVCLKVFANADAAETWFEENDPEGVAFEYEVLE